MLVCEDAEKLCVAKSMYMKEIFEIVHELNSYRGKRACYFTNIMSSLLTVVYTGTIKRVTI